MSKQKYPAAPLTEWIKGILEWVWHFDSVKAIAYVLILFIIGMILSFLIAGTGLFNVPPVDKQYQICLNDHCVQLTIEEVE